MTQFNTQPAPRPTPNQIKILAMRHADTIVQGGSQRNIDDIAAYGDCLRNPEYLKRRIPSPIAAQFLRAIVAAANDELMALFDTLRKDEDRLELLENEIAIMVSTMVEATRKAAGE